MPSNMSIMDILHDIYIYFTLCVLSDILMTKTRKNVPLAHVSRLRLWTVLLHQPSAGGT